MRVDAAGRTKGQELMNGVLPEADLAFLSNLGLKELTLSANPGITAKGWGRLAIAVAHSSQVRVLNLDYNPLGERSTGIWGFSLFPQGDFIGLMASTESESSSICDSTSLPSGPHILWLFWWGWDAVYKEIPVGLE